MERCSTVSAIRKMQTTTALGWVQYKRRMIASIDETVEKLENSCTAGEIVK